jgi:MFS family permease
VTSPIGAISSAPSAPVPGNASLRTDARFRSYWASSAISQFGDRITDLALPLIAITVLHASTSQVGFLTAAVWLPYVGALFVGAWVDRRPHKRRVQVGADLARAALLVTVPVAAWLDVLTLTQLFVIAALAGLAEVFFNTASPNVFVDLVARESYLTANSKLSSMRSVSFLAGPAIGGVLIQLLTAPIAILVDAISFLGSAALLGRIPLAEPAPRAAPVESLLHSAAQGFSFVRKHLFLRASLACATTLNFFNFIAAALLILFGSRELGLSATVIGLSLGIGAIGGLIAAVVAPRLGARFGVGTIIIAGTLISAAGLGIVPFAGGSTLTKAVFFAAAEFVSGVGIMLFDVNLNAVQTTVTPDALRSRSSGAFSTVNYGIRPIGAVVGGVLGSTLGIRPTLAIAAVGMALSCSWLIASPIRSVRRMQQLDGVDPYTGRGMTTI